MARGRYTYVLRTHRAQGRFDIRMLTGLLLGAGASFEAGFPLAADLTMEFRKWLTPEHFRSLNEGWRRQGGGLPDDVVDDVARILVAPGMNYENILGHLEVEFIRNSTHRNDYHALRGKLLDTVYAMLYYRQVKNLHYIERSLTQYSGLAGLAEANRPLWVFTLNHDLIVECVAARFGVPVNAGFEGTVELPTRDPSGKVKGALAFRVLSGERLKKSGFAFSSPAAKGINLLKLHGALDIFTAANGEDLLRLEPQDKSVAGIIESLRSLNEDLFYPIPWRPDEPANVINQIAYADAQGEMQFLRRSILAGAFKFNARVQQVLPHRVLDEFRLRIGHLQRLVAIGYGCGDDHINTVVREWLERSRNNRLELVAPGACIPSTFAHVARQVEAIDMRATQYLARYAQVPPGWKDHAFAHFRSLGRALQRRLYGHA